jgi:hypothetical protein
MNRRGFIALFGGAATWPLAARAQQPGKLPTIGFLGPQTLAAESLWTAAFVQRLRELGWIEGRTVAIEYRCSDGLESGSRVRGDAERASRAIRWRLAVHQGQRGSPLG